MSSLHRNAIVTEKTACNALIFRNELRVGKVPYDIQKCTQVLLDLVTLDKGDSAEFRIIF